jgi:pimeloyl-ACP methyl ester carboxylesterase
MHIVLIALAVAVLVYLALCAALLVFQRSFLYFPQPSSLGSRDTTIVLPIADAKVVASMRPRDGRDAVIYFGGNGEDVTMSVSGLTEAFPEHALYLLHYRGYGGSAGTPSEAAIVADALVLFDHARREHPDVVVVGRSLGSGVAVRVASLRPVTRLALVTPYDSIQDIAAARFAFFPVRWLLRDKFESWRYAPAVTAPTLLLAAEHDDVIPRASTETLLARFKPGVAAMKVVRGTGHNSISDHADYTALLRAAPRAP